MKILRLLYLPVIFLCAALSAYSQDKTDIPQRTPEQEATRQTEKLQQELNLTPEQSKQVYDINLRYARERQQSNTRAQALERMKNKDADLQRVLNEEQFNQLRSKRYERTSIQMVQSGNRSLPNTSSGFVPSSGYRSVRPSQTPSTDNNPRVIYRSGSNYRPNVNTSTQRGSQNQLPTAPSLRRSLTPSSSRPNIQPQNSNSQQAPSRMQSTPPAPTRTQSSTPAPSQNRTGTTSTTTTPNRR